jgi:hypothetical protein
MAKPLKKSVALDQPVKVSRIRRDPVPIVHPGEAKKVQLRTSEREIWIAIAGIVMFALAIDIVTVAASAYSQNSVVTQKPGPIVISQKS